MFVSNSFLRPRFGQIVRRFALCAVVATTSFVGTSLPVSAQMLELGVKVGAPLNDLVDAQQDRTVPFSIGGVAALNLPGGVAVEANALYKRLGFRIDGNSAIGGSVADGRFNSWEFPIMLKSYPLGRNPLIQPFLSAGLNIRSTATGFLGLGNNRETTTGLLIGAGVRNGPGRIKIAPEIRYTRWRRGVPLYSGADALDARLSPNQLEVLVGITF